MRTTYVESQWTSPSMQTWLREQRAAWSDDDGFARYLSHSLRVGTIEECLSIILRASNEVPT